MLHSLGCVLWVRSLGPCGVLLRICDTGACTYCYMDSTVTLACYHSGQGPNLDIVAKNLGRKQAMGTFTCLNTSTSSTLLAVTLLSITSYSGGCIKADCTQDGVCGVQPPSSCSVTYTVSLET